MELVTRNAEEILTMEELRELLETKARPRAYWGFELSGKMHLGMGLVCSSKIRDLVEAGFDFTVFLADWHSWINNKMGGDMSKIREVGEYFKHCFTALGLDPGRVEYVWASDIVRDVEYWERVIKIGKSMSLQRIWRALPIMGREMTLTDVESAWIYYPPMQATDIFQLRLDAACGGIDQRKAHIVAREAAEKLGWTKPVCVHTHLVAGLQGPSGRAGNQFDEDPEVNVQISSKMSKSMPGNCIFIHDSPEEISEKIRAAFCPPKEVRANPILEIAKYMIFPEINILHIPRSSKHGGPKDYGNYLDLESEYAKGLIHPLDLKNGVSEALIRILEKVREYFKRNPKSLEKMRELDITR